MTDVKKKGEGRERYLDMVQRERSLLVEKGINRTLEQLLVAAGGLETSDEEKTETERFTATGDQLRAAVPVQAWMPLNIHLVGLTNGVLEVAPLYDFNDRQKENLVATVKRSGFRVDSVEIQL